ncbi:MAG TPA: hypothetical protein VFK05_17905 [Polyangiaceae bacterium]|nr:hypothetical protein [Polyangiaceae bacterium]
MKHAWLIALGLFALPACEKKETPPAVDSAAVSAPAPTPVAPSAVAEAPPAIDVESLPVEEDFDAEAEKTVTLSNMNAQLDALEKEINAP